MRVHIALLRAINVGGHNRVPMQELRRICSELGWREIQTYIQSGNVVFSARAAVERLERELEGALREELGLSIPVVVRRADAWEGIIEGNPFPEASEGSPNLVMAGLAKSPPAAGALDLLLARAAVGERIARVGDALWFHFPAGSAKSRIGPSLIDRAAGSSVTLRNWRTVLKLGELTDRTAKH